MLACSRHTDVHELQISALLSADCAKVAAMAPAVSSLEMQKCSRITLSGPEISREPRSSNGRQLCLGQSLSSNPIRKPLMSYKM